MNRHRVIDQRSDSWWLYRGIYTQGTKQTRRGSGCEELLTQSKQEKTHGENWTMTRADEKQALESHKQPRHSA